jgi:hypothetical protein
VLVGVGRGRGETRMSREIEGGKGNGTWRGKIREKEGEMERGKEGN